MPEPSNERPLPKRQRLSQDQQSDYSGPFEWRTSQLKSLSPSTTFLFQLRASAAVKGRRKEGGLQPWERRSAVDPAHRLRPRKASHSTSIWRILQFESSRRNGCRLTLLKSPLAFGSFILRFKPHSSPRRSTCAYLPGLPPDLVSFLTCPIRTRPRESNFSLPKRSWWKPRRGSGVTQMKASG